METIVCWPEGSAIPSGDCAVPSGDNTTEHEESRGAHGVAPSVDLLVQSDDVLPNRVIQSDNGASGVAPNEDSLQSTNSYDNLVV